MVDQDVESLKTQIAELQEQLAFWIGEGDDETCITEESEWLTLARIAPQARTQQQNDRIRELGRFIMESDADYWKSRAAKAETKLREIWESASCSEDYRDFMVELIRDKRLKEFGRYLMANEENLSDSPS